MNKMHWSVVPALLAAGWLLLAGATVFTLSDMPVDSSRPAAEQTMAQPAPHEDLPAIVVVASR